MRPASLRPSVFTCITVTATLLTTALGAQAVPPVQPVPATPAVSSSRTGGPRTGIDVLHYTFRVEFPAAVAPDTVRFISTVKARRTAAVNSLMLDLVAAMHVDSVQVGARTAAFTRSGNSIGVTLPTGTGDTLQVAVHYHGVPRDGLIIRRDSIRGWTAFGDNFPDRARQWLAVVDHPADKALVTWDVLAPATHRVIANGTLLEESPDVAPVATRRVRTRWASQRPLYTAVMVIGVAPFAVVELPESTCIAGELPGCVRQSVWTSPVERDAIPAGFTRANEIVALFSRLAGPFPYEKLAHVSSSTRYGGMENASAIFYSSAIFKPGDARESLVAHETAHQWFGDAVTTREWPHVWLSEGFATYFAALWAEHAHGDSALRSDLAAMRSKVLAAPITVQKAVVDETLDDLGRVLNSNVYEKAGFVLHMLRREIGDSAFFNGIRAYYAAHRHGNALTGDAQAAFEKAAGRELGWFFDQWMRRPGVAAVKADWRWDAARRAVVVTVTQGSRVAPYRLSLSVAVQPAGDGMVVRQRITVPAQTSSTIVLDTPLSAAPASVTFDDDVSLLGTIEFATSAFVPPAAAPVIVAGAWTTADGVHTVDGTQWSGTTDSAALARSSMQLFGSVNDAFVRNSGAAGAFPLLVQVTSVTGHGREVLSTGFQLIGGASDQNAGVMFGLQPNGSYHYVRYNTKDGDLALWVFENGERRLILHGTGHRQLELGAWHTLRVTLDGRELHASIDGVADVVLHHTLDVPVRGPTGLWVKRDAVTAFRNWRAERTIGSLPQ